MNYRPQIWMADADPPDAHIADWREIRRRAFDGAARKDAAFVYYVDDGRYVAMAMDKNGQPFQFEYFGDVLTHNSFGGEDEIQDG